MRHIWIIVDKTATDAVCEQVRTDDEDFELPVRLVDTDADCQQCLADAGLYDPTKQVAFFIGSNFIECRWRARLRAGYTSPRDCRKSQSAAIAARIDNYSQPTSGTGTIPTGDTVRRSGPSFCQCDDTEDANEVFKGGTLIGHIHLYLPKADPEAHIIPEDVARRWEAADTSDLGTTRKL